MANDVINHARNTASITTPELQGLENVQAGECVRHGEVACRWRGGAGSLACLPQTSPCASLLLGWGQVASLCDKPGTHETVFLSSVIGGHGNLIQSQGRSPGDYLDFRLPYTEHLACGAWCPLQVDSASGCPEGPRSAWRGEPHPW